MDESYAITSISTKVNGIDRNFELKKMLSFSKFMLPVCVSLILYSLKQCSAFQEKIKQNLNTIQVEPSLMSLKNNHL